MGAELCESVVDDQALARPSHAFTLLRVGEISPEAYPLWIVDECHRTRRSEYRQRLAPRGPIGSVRMWTAEMKAVIRVCKATVDQRHYDPTFGFGVLPIIAVARSFS
jgi:type I site-specific restriction endonuclease